MIITVITWAMMWNIFSIYGLAINVLIKRKTNYTQCSLFDLLWFGIAAVTVYVQFFSLIYKVGVMAFSIAAVLALFLVFLLKDEYSCVIKELIFKIKRKPAKSCIILFVMGIFIFVGGVFTIQTPSHYDTYLYHAQNIRWIEEYGVVKGLGNFHNRFAYNSSFLCLQALFSFSWCLSQSLHTLNGFLWVFMSCYVFGTLKVYKENKVFLSDIFKFLTLTYLFNSETTKMLSSPHTDMMTMLLVIYILTRWIELLEQKEKSYIPYGVLCLLGVFSVSVKLSAALVLILVLKPAFELLKVKEWKTIITFITSGIIIIIPFLIRNVMLSGYLVYPYASIDLFNVDWKMPASQVIFDNHEIIAWGRMLRDVNRYSEPMKVWLPIWLENSGSTNRTFMIINLILLPIMVVMAFYNFYRKKYDRSLVIICCSALFAGWLFTAPLPRYGAIYMYLLPILFSFMIVRKIPKFVLHKWKYFVYMCAFIISMNMMQNVKDEVGMLKYGNRLFPKDYGEYSVCEVLWNEVEVYLPVSGDQVSYHKFPSTPYSLRLDLIELRGENLEDGFKIKDEFEGRKISTYGFFLD